MGNVPGFGVKTNITDEDQIEQIITDLVDVFEFVEKEQDGVLIINDEWRIHYNHLEGFDEYMGMSNEGLAFTHSASNYPEWDEFVERGNRFEDICDFIEKENPMDNVSNVIPLAPYV